MYTDDISRSWFESRRTLRVHQSRISKYLLYVLLGWLAAELLALIGFVVPPHQHLFGLLTSPHYYLSSAFFAFFIFHMFMRLSIPERFFSAAVGVAASLSYFYIFDLAKDGLILGFLKSLQCFGFTSLLVLGFRSLVVSEEKEENVYTLSLGSLLPLTVMVSWPFLSLTSALHPETFDRSLRVFDLSLGVPIVEWSIAVGKAGILPLFQLVYLALPVAIALLSALNLKYKTGNDVFLGFLLTALIGYIFYHFLPASGPVYAFYQLYPDNLPGIDEVTQLSSMVSPDAPRNAVPSLHTAWALLLWVNTRGLRFSIAIGFKIFTVLTLVATMALGEHYFVDLVIAAPFVVAIVALTNYKWLKDKLVAQRIIGFGLLSVIVWVIAIRWFIHLFVYSSVLSWLSVFLCIFVANKWYRELMAVPRLNALPQRTGSKLTTLRLDAVVVGLMFVLSGFAGLMYQVLFSKALALTFGSTATATNTVLATYMAGMALGTWIGGRLLQETKKPLKAYAFCELGIAVFCAITPWLFDFVQALYKLFAHDLEPESSLLLFYRVVLGGGTLFIPTLLMGMTLPALARFFDLKSESLGRSVGTLYMANTVGAALGALLTGYFIIPELGVTYTIVLAVFANIFVGVLAMCYGVWVANRDLVKPNQPSQNSAYVGQQVERKFARLSLVLLAVGGVLTLALEVNYIQILAVVAGNSTYAFSLMLFTFLLGLGAGSSISRHMLVRRINLPLTIFYLEVGLATSVLLGLLVWDEIPRYFASFDTYPLTRSFSEREFVRGLVCFIGMFPVAFFIGALYPLCMEAASHINPGKKIRILGLAAGVNTLGNIIGVLLAGFVALPALGSYKTLQLIVLVVLLQIALIILVCGVSNFRRRGPLLALASIGGLMVMLPGGFNYTALASGANVYFHYQGYGKVIEHAESLDGGLTTVAESYSQEGDRVLTLLTNGKFQGDDSFSREMMAQASFSIIPLMYTESRDKALAIGFGTGVSARVIHDSGFKHLDVVDLSGDIIHLADKFFSKVNDGVIRKKGVDVHVTDGRNFLMLQGDNYDFVGMEVSSIWFAGAASLYNKEFYELVNQRLAPGGVFQQWIQLHRLSKEDIAYIIGSLQSVFDSVWVYVSGSQGVIVATKENLLPSVSSIEKLNNESALRQILMLFDGNVSNSLYSCVLTPSDTKRFLSKVDPDNRKISTDDNLYLEHNTPKGNVRDYWESINENIAYLRSFGKDNCGSRSYWSERL